MKRPIDKIIRCGCGGEMEAIKSWTPPWWKDEDKNFSEVTRKCNRCSNVKKRKEKLTLPK